MIKRYIIFPEKKLNHLIYMKEFKFLMEIKEKIQSKIFFSHFKDNKVVFGCDDDDNIYK